LGSIAISDDVLQGVASYARDHGVTLDEQAEAWLRDAVAHHGRHLELMQKFEAIAALSPNGPHSDAVDDLREVRNR
jgi:hypothetical protein